jgi:hypothetical protein
MGLTEEIKKGLDVDLESKFAAAVDKGICDGVYDTIFSDEDENNIEYNKKKISKNEDIHGIYGINAKTLEIRSQLEKIMDMVNHTGPDFISIDIKVKTLTSKQRYRHKGSRVKISFFE